MLKSSEYTVWWSSFHSIADSEGVVVSSEGSALVERSDLDAAVPNWTASEYCTRFRRMLDTRRFARMFLDGRSKAMADRRYMLYETDTGTRE